MTMPRVRNDQAMRVPRWLLRSHSAPGTEMAKAPMA